MSEVVYISGPITLGGTVDPAPFIARFYEEEERLLAEGHEVINPCRCDEQPDWAGYMRIHIPSVCRATRVVALPGWQHSRGASLEVYIATQLGIPVALAVSSSAVSAPEKEGT